VGSPEAGEVGAEEAVARSLFSRPAPAAAAVVVAVVDSKERLAVAAAEAVRPSVSSSIIRTS